MKRPMQPLVQNVTRGDAGPAIRTFVSVFLTLASISLFSSPSFAKFAFAADNFKATQVYKASDTIWGFDFLSEDEILLSQKNGTIIRADLKTGKGVELKGGPTPIVGGQGGLLDLKIRRDGDKTWVYLTAAAAPEKGSQSDREKKQTTALFRAEYVAGTSPSLKGLTRLFEAEPAVDSGLHFGSRLAFAKDGALFMTVGERNERERAQKLDQHWGKVLRLTLDGKPFASNPFIKGDKVAGIVPRPEIFSFGHRNPQGIAVAKDGSADGSVYESEHGPRGGDEINLLAPGKNYGWPEITYGREYYGPKIGATEKAGLEQPIKYYVPSIAPSSLMIYSGKKFKEFTGLFFQGALVLQHLNVLNIKTGEDTRLFTDRNERIRNVVESPAGEIYISTDSWLVLRVDRK